MQVLSQLTCVYVYPLPMNNSLCSYLLDVPPMDRKSIRLFFPVMEMEMYMFIVQIIPGIGAHLFVVSSPISLYNVKYNILHCLFLEALHAFTHLSTVKHNYCKGANEPFLT